MAANANQANLLTHEEKTSPEPKSDESKTPSSSYGAKRERESSDSIQSGEKRHLRSSEAENILDYDTRGAELWIESEKLTETNYLVYLDNKTQCLLNELEKRLSKPLSFPLVMNPVRQKSNPGSQKLNPDTQKSNPDSQKSYPDAQKSNPDALKMNLDAQKFNPDVQESNPDDQNSDPDGQNSNSAAQNSNPDSQNLYPEGQNSNSAAQKSNPDCKKLNPDAQIEDKITIALCIQELTKSMLRDEQLRRKYLAEMINEYRRLRGAMSDWTKVYRLNRQELKVLLDTVTSISDRLSVVEKYVLEIVRNIK